MRGFLSAKDNKARNCPRLAEALILCLQAILGSQFGEILIMK